MKSIAILAYPGCSGAQVLGLHDSMLLANRVAVEILRIQPIFEVRVTGLSGRSVTAAGGIRMSVGRQQQAPDFLVVPGFALAEDGVDECLKSYDEHIRFIAEAFRRGTPVAAVCVGAFLLGQAGILDHRHATTAWMYSAELARRYPAAIVEPHAILIEDGGITTTGGFSVAFDLAIHLIRKTAGDEVATAFAKFAMLDTNRTSQAPFVDSALLAQANGAFSASIKHWLDQRLTEPYQLDRLARVFAMSPRTLLRRFQAEAGESPLSYLQRARIRTAKGLLESTTLRVSEVTERVGYENVSTFVRLFRREVGHSPARYRTISRSQEVRPL